MAAQLIKCSCGQSITMNTFGNKKLVVYSDHNGNAIKHCGKCGKELSNKN